MNKKIFQIPNLPFYFRIIYSDEQLYELTFADHKNQLLDTQLSLKILNNSSTKLGKEVQNQLTAYFDQKLKKFDIPTSISGSSFSKKVFSEMSKIPYGETRSYKHIR